MKNIKIVSICKTNCYSKTFKKVVDNKGKISQIVAYEKHTKSGWAMYIETSILPNGKKVSVTKHGPIPK